MSANTKGLSLRRGDLSFFTAREASLEASLGSGAALVIKRLVMTNPSFEFVREPSGEFAGWSALNSGTTFRVHLPALAAGLQKEEGVKGIDFPSGKGELVLVVDDEAAIRDLARTILENYGYRVLVAADGVEAVTLYAQYREAINVVLTDLDMPRMNGAQLIRKLLEMNDEVRIISVSGLIESDTLNGQLDSNVRGVLQKPFSPAQLLQTLRFVLHG
jgi:CheY-like chemotaxis protein